MKKLSDLLKRQQPVLDPREAVYAEGDGTADVYVEPKKITVIRHKDLLKKRKVQNSR